MGLKSLSAIAVCYYWSGKLSDLCQGYTETLWRHFWENWTNLAYYVGNLKVEHHVPKMGCYEEMERNISLCRELYLRILSGQVITIFPKNFPLWKGLPCTWINMAQWSWYEFWGFHGGSVSGWDLGCDTM